MLIHNAEYQKVVAELLEISSKDWYIEGKFLVDDTEYWISPWARSLIDGHVPANIHTYIRTCFRSVLSQL